MSLSKSKLYKIVFFFLGWPISILSFYFLFKIISPKLNVISSISKPSLLPLAIGIVCFLFYLISRVLLWEKILTFKNVHIPLYEAAFSWSISELNRFIPGYIWSPVTKTILFSKKNISKTIILRSIIIESQFIGLGSILVSFLSIPFLLTYVLKNKSDYVSILIIVSFFVFILTVVYILQEKINFRNTFLNYVLPYFNPKQILILLGISSISFFFFSLATYFTIVSFIFLSPKNIIDFIGLFAFSYCVGFFSLITPMGLGVREGVIVLGLSSIIPVPLAVVASVVARAFLIISELLFLAVSYFWKKIKIKTPNPHIAILSFFIISYIFYFTFASFSRHDNFYTGRFDLGNMDQTAWNTIHGKIFKLTDPDGTEVISRLAYHADFILVPLSALYLIWADPKMLLLVQVLVVACGALFVYKIAKFILGNNTIALIFSIVYLFNPSLNHAVLYDFHSVTLASTFLLGTFYFLLKRNNWLFIVFLTLASFTKEQVWIIAAAFGFYIALYAAFFKKNASKFLFGFLIVLVSLSIFYYLIWKGIPQARGSHHFALSYYSDLGDSPRKVIQAVIFSPKKVLKVITEPSRLLYVKDLFLPLGFLSIFSPLALSFALPDFLINVLSNNTQLREIYYQYTVTITSFLFVSAIFGVKNVKKIFPKIPLTFFGVFILICTLYASYFYGPLPGAYSPNLDMFIKPHPHKKEITTFLSSIPARYSVAATNNIGAHLSHRQKIFTIPIGMDKADIIAFLLDDQFAQPSPQAQREMVEKLRVNSRYKKLYEIDNFVVFQRLTHDG